MLDQATEPLTGRLTLTNEGLNVGHSAPHEMADNELIDWVVDTLDLGDLPTVIFDPRVAGGELRFYERGLSQLAHVRIFPVGAIHAVTLEDVKSVIDIVHGESLITPQQQIGRATTWERAASHWVANNAEAVIQSQIRIALVVQFPLLEIEHEGAVRSGRFDLCIGYFEPETASYTWFGVLELKVLKTKGSTGRTYSDASNKGAIMKGMKQAFSYRENRHANWGSLCCFDMRDFDDATDKCFDHVRDTADKQSIDLSRWRLHNTSEALQIIPS